MPESLPGSDVAAVIKHILRAVRGTHEDIIMKACLAIVIGLQNPDLTMPQLAQGVKDVSEYTALWVSGAVPNS